MTSLRKIPWLKHSWIIFCGERGTGHDSSFLSYDLDKYEPKLMKIGRKSARDGREIGWWSNPTTKTACLETARILVSSGSVAWMRDWVFSNGVNTQTREEVAQDLRTQLFRYGTYEFIRGTSKSVKISGQIDETGKISRTLRDDKADAFCMACGIMREILSRRFSNLDYSELFPPFA